MSAQTSQTNGVPLVRMEKIGRRFGTIVALEDVDFEVGYQEIVGLLGDNGAGKSTLIKVLTGVHPATSGRIYFEGQPVTMSSPQDAHDLGIETVYQDLALVPLMGIARNFYLGREPNKHIGPVVVLDQDTMSHKTAEALGHIGIQIRGPEEPVGTLSGGERQSIAIGRAVHFGTKLLILDEPTSALSIGETRKVINYTFEAKKRGLSVIFITHNIHHVFEVADRFTIISHGHKVGEFRRDEVTPDDVAAMIMGEPVPERLRDRPPLQVPTRPMRVIAASTAAIAADGTQAEVRPVRSIRQHEQARRTRTILTYVIMGLVVLALMGMAWLYARPTTTETIGVPPLVKEVFGLGFSFKVPEDWKQVRAESGILHWTNDEKKYKIQVTWDSAKNKGVSTAAPLSQAAKQLQDQDLFGLDFKPGEDITVGGIKAYRFGRVNPGQKFTGIEYIMIDKNDNFIDLVIEGPSETWDSDLKPLADAIIATLQFR